jgi:hypothetical protein
MLQPCDLLKVIRCYEALQTYLIVLIQFSEWVSDQWLSSAAAQEIQN